MKINDKFFIYMARDTKRIYTNLPKGVKTSIGSDDANYPAYRKIVQICRKRSMPIKSKNMHLTAWLKRIDKDLTDAQLESCMYGVAETEAPKTDNVNVETTASKNATTTTIDKAFVARMTAQIAEKVIKFFSEFNFTPSFRFTNTLMVTSNPTEYVLNYFNIQNHIFNKEISDKIKSPEFKSICDDIQLINKTISSKPINTRFALYFGEPGTGKTTQAMTEGTTCIVCTSDMLPSDIMTNFDFDEGKATFKKSDFWKAMEEGTTVILDEINMLPFETLRFLQGVLDDKPSIDFKGNHITIHKDFKVIGTMNLNVNGQSMPLPAPLADRCSVIKEFTMNKSILAKALVKNFIYDDTETTNDSIVSEDTF